MNKKLLYVALSRTKETKFINLGNYKTVVFWGSIYQYTNMKNGKVYIGSTDNVAKRKEEHLQATDNSKFHKALRKYGIVNFLFEVLERKRYGDHEQLHQREQHFIKSTKPEVFASWKNNILLKNTNRLSLGITL